MKTVVKVLWFIFIASIAIMAGLMVVSGLTGCKTTKQVNKQAVKVESNTERQSEKDSTGRTETILDRYVQSQTTFIETIDTVVRVMVPVPDTAGVTQWIPFDVPVIKHKRTEKKEYAKEQQKTTRQAAVSSSEKEKEQKSDATETVTKDVQRLQFPWWIIAPVVVIIVVLIATRKIWRRMIGPRL
jgi:hypothetical protein